MRNRVLLELNSADLDCDPILPPSLQTSYVFLGIVLALIGAIFLLVLYLNRKGIKSGCITSEMPAGITWKGIITDMKSMRTPG